MWMSEDAPGEVGVVGVEGELAFREDVEGGFAAQKELPNWTRLVRFFVGIFILFI